MQFGTTTDYEPPPPFQPFPSKEWFLAVYTRDVWAGLPSLLAAATSTYGSILKIDSTKKICRKPQGKAANTASWATNVGNETGQVLVSVFTDSESISKCLAELSFQSNLHHCMYHNRYKMAQKSHPKVLYTDRDRCSSSGPSKYQVRFKANKVRAIHV